LDKKEAIDQRLAEAKEEIKQGQYFDLLIVNDEFEEALADLKTIIISNKTLRTERKDLVNFCLKGLLEE
jgi:guanylate kinase